MNSVSEKIDERILRLLGLEDVFDLDYDTYLTELKEAIVKGSFGKNKIPDEELALLANERKRIRGKKGRFKPKKEKITASKVATTKLLKGTKKVAIVSSAIAKPDIQQQDLTGIGKPLQSIAKTLADFLNFKKKTGEEERKEKESQKRTKKEEGLEGLKKGISAVSGAAKKMLAPFQSIIDRIWKFIFFTLLGRAFTQLMGWLGDPANKKKIEVLGRFLKDWWPALAFAAGLFLTPFGGFIRSTIKLLRGFIPLIARHPLLALTLGAGVAGAAAGFSLEKNLKNVDEKLLQRRIQESKDQGKPLTQQEIEKIKLDQLKKRVQDIQGTAIPGSALAAGGIVPRFSMGGINFGTGYDGIDGSTGQKVSGFGPDTQAIIAQPGEIVINKKTVDAVGADHFLGLNRMHGGPGANKPKMGRLYNTGGMVGGVPGGNKQFGEMPLITEAMRAGIKGQELSAFLAQMSHETGGFKWNRELGRGEGMGYSGGSAYHGRGYTQLTHDYNYRHFGNKLGVDLVKDPDLLLKDPKLSARVAIEYWKERVRPNVKNWDNTFEVSSAINNPSAIKPNQISGYEDRVKKSEHYSQNLPKIIEKYQPKTDPKVNQQKLINKRPWWDKFGWFGGASRHIQKKQGGGEITPENLERTYIQGQKSGVNPEILKAIGDEAFLLKNFGPGGVWKNFKGSGATDYRGNIIPKKMSGGLIKENTGMNIRGATADRQLTALHPGEFVITAGAVNKFGIDFFEKINSVDYDSTAAKLGKKPINSPSITPLSRGNRQGMITLPPITQSASGGMSGGAAGSKVPSFSASSPSGGSERSMNASIYGIVG
jgi:predicted chitinase